MQKGGELGSCWLRQLLILVYLSKFVWSFKSDSRFNFFKPVQWFQTKLRKRNSGDKNESWIMKSKLHQNLFFLTTMIGQPPDSYWIYMITSAGGNFWKITCESSWNPVNCEILFLPDTNDWSAPWLLLNSRAPPKGVVPPKICEKD